MQRSLERLGTDYLDVVLLHDAEFVAVVVSPPEGTAGHHASAVTDPKVMEQWGLAPGKEDVIHGPGDEKVIAAARELFKMKEEGVIKAVGISGTTSSPTSSPLYGGSHGNSQAILSRRSCVSHASLPHASSP